MLSLTHHVQIDYILKVLKQVYVRTSTFHGTGSTSIGVLAPRFCTTYCTTVLLSITISRLSLDYHIVNVLRLSSLARYFQ